MGYDAAFTADMMHGKPLPAKRWANVTIPVLVADGGASPAWVHNAADALVRVLPDAQRCTLEGEQHAVTPEVLVPVLEKFYQARK